MLKQCVRAECCPSPCEHTGRAATPTTCERCRGEQGPAPHHTACLFYDSRGSGSACPGIWDFWSPYLVLKPNCSHSYQLGHGKCPTGAHHQNTSGAEHHARMQLCATSHSISLYPLVMLPLCFQTERLLLVSATRCPRSLPVPVPCTKPPPNSHSGSFL